MLTGALAFLLLIVALLAIPVTLVYQVNWHARWQGDVELQWLFGLLHVRIPVSPATTPTAAKQARPKPARRAKPKSKTKSNPLAALRQRSFRQRLMKFVRDLWQAIHKRDVSMQVQIGLDDPADTGRLWAILGPVSALLANSRNIQIDIQPDFADATLALDSSGNIRIIPVQIIALTLALLLSPPFWQGMRQMRQAG
jgi:hypothetical protein